MALAITPSNFEQIFGSENLLLIDFWAEWCGPCKMLTPIIEELSVEYSQKGVTIAKCDIEANNDLAVRFGIRNIPTILFFKNGQIVDKQIGAVPKHTLEEKIKNLL